MFLFFFSFFFSLFSLISNNVVINRFNSFILFIYRPLIITSLILIAIGNGSIRACITSLGGSQFVLPTQSKELDQFFSHYYFIYTLGIMLAKIISPEIRAQTQCFGQNECYTAVFAALATIFFIAWSKLNCLNLSRDENHKVEKQSLQVKIICFFPSSKSSSCWACFYINKKKSTDQRRIFCLKLLAAFTTALKAS